VAHLGHHALGECHLAAASSSSSATSAAASLWGFPLALVVIFEIALALEGRPLHIDGDVTAHESVYFIGVLFRRAGFNSIYNDGVVVALDGQSIISRTLNKNLELTTRQRGYIDPHGSWGNLLGSR
jgi:hypothetical protein